jgi:hypothetical protein
LPRQQRRRRCRGKKKDSLTAASSPNHLPIGDRVSPVNDTYARAALFCLLERKHRSVASAQSGRYGVDEEIASCPDPQLML